jgi:multidrug transporter EmrE-like cation transporter
MKALLPNFLCAALAVASNGLLAHTLKGRISWRGSLITLLWDVFELLRSPLVWVGAMAFIACQLLWLFILSSQRMSVAYPLMISLVFLFSTLISIFIFSERLSLPGCIGLAFVVSGVILVSRG